VWLVLIPIAVAVLFSMLLLPRRGVPDSVPVPIPDGRELERVATRDRDLAEQARREALPGPVRALGSAIRAYHVFEAGGDGRDLGRARSDVDAAFFEARQAGEGPLLRLRAVEVESFLVELRRFESTGVESDEIAALAGAFVRSMRIAGWCQGGHTLLPDEAARRAMFKQMWNAFLGLDSTPAFALSLDEQRALYALFLSYPHPSPARRDSLERARRGAHDARACQALVEAERAATEEWRIDRIGRLASIDPTYPAAYAHGVASFRRGDYMVAARDFQAWLTAHPDGELSLRAQSFLRAAAGPAQVE
jgi:hypothetical protein